MSINQNNNVDDISSKDVPCITKNLEDKLLIASKHVDNNMILIEI